MATLLMSAAPSGAASGAAGAPAPAAQTRFLAVDGGRIAYDDSGGKGPLILALPGMGDLRSQYRLLRPELERAGYRVVTMDMLRSKQLSHGICKSPAAWQRSGR